MSRPPSLWKLPICTVSALLSVQDMCGLAWKEEFNIAGSHYQDVMTTPSSWVLVIPSPSEFSVACHTSETCSIKVWAVNLDFSLSQTGRECSRKLFLRLGLLGKIKGSYECFVSKGCLSLLVSIFYRDNLGIGITGVASSFWQSKTFSSLKD